MNTRPLARRNQRGFTLVELMIAVTLGLVLMAGVSQIYLSSKQGYTVQDNLARLQESGRYALDAITNDLRLAGYWGGNGDVSTIGGAVTPAATCAGTDWGLMVGQRVFGLNDTKTGYDCIGSDYLTSDVLTVRHAAPDKVTAFNDYRLYLRASLFDGRVFLGKFQASNTVTAVPPATAHALVANAYYIESAEKNPECLAAGAVPGLAREHLTNSGTPSQEELVRGIENLQLRYGLDTNGDRSVDTYVDAGAVTDWRQVVAVRVWLLARSECPELGYTNNYTYQLGDQSIVVNDGFRRQVYTTTVMLRNQG